MTAFLYVPVLFVCLDALCRAHLNYSVALEAQLEASDVPTKRVADAPSSTPFETEVTSSSIYS